MYLGDIYTISVNLAGLPGISIPVGRDAKGLPVGMQLIGDCFQEKKLFQAAYTYECLTEKKWVSMYDKTEAAGREPGIPVHTGQVCVFGAPPNAVLHPQKIFVFVASST